MENSARLTDRKMAHDIKNALGVIKMRCDILALYSEQSTLNTETLQTSLDAINEQVQSILEIVNGETSTEA